MFANIDVVKALFKCFVDNFFYNIPVSTAQAAADFVWNVNVLKLVSNIFYPKSSKVLVSVSLPLKYVLAILLNP